MLATKIETLVVQQTIDEIVPMSADEARAAFDFLKRSLEDCRQTLLEIQRRQGWRQLGYKTWREAIATEFGESQSKAYRELAAAVVEDFLGEELARFAPIGSSEGEILKRLEEKGTEAMIQALEQAEQLAVERQREKRTLIDLHEAVDGILFPNWKSLLFSIKVEEKTFNIQCKVTYFADGKRIKFYYKGQPDSISEDGSFEEDMDKRLVKNYDSPKAYAHKRLLEIYPEWQVKVIQKAKLGKEYPKDTFVKITRDLPGCSGDAGKVCIVVDAGYDGLCIQPIGEDAIIVPPGYYQAIKVGEAGKPICKLKDVESAQDMDALIDVLGAKMLAIAFTQASAEIQQKISYFYPGIGALVAAEVGTAAYNETTKNTGQLTKEEANTVVVQQIESSQKLEAAQTLLQQKEEELIELKSQIEAQSQAQIPTDVEEQLNLLKADLEHKNQLIEQLQSKLQEKDEAAQRIERLEAELQLMESSKPNLEDLIEPTLERMGWKNPATITAGRSVLKKFIESLRFEG